MIADTARTALAALTDKVTDDIATALMADPAIAADVADFIVTYSGRFGFMLDMQDAYRRFGPARFGLARYRGVLNVMRAEALRPVATAVATVVPNGIYTAVRADGDYTTVRVKGHFDATEKGLGAQVLQYLVGPDNTSDYESAGTVRGGSLTVWRRIGDRTAASLAEAWAIISGDPAAAGEAYALKSGACFRCNRTLTVPASLHRGLGPECVKKWHGALPGGAVILPRKRR
jgi:hypothetical protein